MAGGSLYALEVARNSNHVDRRDTRGAADFFPSTHGDRADNEFSHHSNNHSFLCQLPRLHEQRNVLVLFESIGSSFFRSSVIRRTSASVCAEGIFLLLAQHVCMQRIWTSHHTGPLRHVVEFVRIQ